MKLEAIEILTLKNISLEMELLSVKMQQLQSANSGVSGAIARRLDIKIEDYALDMENGVLKLLDPPADVPEVEVVTADLRA